MLLPGVCAGLGLVSPHVAYLPALLPLEAGSTDPVSWLVNYGVAGVVIALLAIGRFRTKQEVDGLNSQLADARSEIKAKDAALLAMMQQVTGHTLPQLGHLADVLERLSHPNETASNTALKAQIDKLAATLAGLDERAGGA